MILQALVDYYERKVTDRHSGVAPQGFEWKEIPFVVVIDADGGFVALEDTREGEGKAKRAKQFLVPQGEKRTVGIRANLLWDNVEYALGANPREREDIERRHKAFAQRVRDDLGEMQQAAARDALLSFLGGDPAAKVEADSTYAELWEEAKEANANVTFRLEGSAAASISDEFREELQARAQRKEIGRERCLVTGERAAATKTHPSLKGVRGAQATGAALVSFNAKAYESFGREQNLNAPVGERATFAYTTALNLLLGKDSRNKLQVGDATTVFWSEQRTALENEFAHFFTMAPKDDPDRDVQAVRSLYRALDTGSLELEATTRFFVLGLAPNAARLSVRFWHQGTVAEFSERLRAHFDDLEVVRPAKDTGKFSLFWLLVDIAMERKLDNVPPNLAGDTVRAILEGAAYPRTLLQQTIRRIRAEQRVSRMRAAILKASLNRFYRTHATQEKEITVALDQENNNAGYRLGRLFAALEKIQEDSHPGLNATIRDRYYGAASANPVTVFPQLLKLKNHHLSKLDNPRFRGAHEKRLTEIMSGLAADMPAHLAMEDQARFAIGYYHQRQAFYSKSSTDGAAISEETEK